MPKMFQLPAPITFLNPTTREPLEGEHNTCTFRRTFGDAAMSVRDVWSGYKALRAANKIEDAIEAAEKGDGLVVLDGEHYELLKKAIEHDQALAGWHPSIARQLLPHVDAVLDAIDYVAPAVRKAE